MSNARCLRHNSSAGASAPLTVTRAGPSTRAWTTGGERIRLGLSEVVRLRARRRILPRAMNAPALEDVQRAVGDHYEVLDLAGVGGMGAVFRARHRTLGHLVAVKVLPPDVATSQMRQDRFKREASLAAQLSHPNIVPVYEFDTREGLSFLIMPFVRGRTLESALVERQQVPVREILRLLREIGAALDAAHRR